MGLQLHPIQRVANVNWGGLQQGLVAEWPGFKGFVEIGSAGPPVAYAIDSGKTYSNVNMGASGSGYTVLTKGLVCFGKPRDGDGCFIAAPDFILPANYYSESNAPQNNNIKRGVVKDDGSGGRTLQWSVVTSGDGLQALTFAGKAFHAVFQATAAGPTLIKTSFDGENWEERAAYPAAPALDSETIGGAVAFNGDIGDTPGSFASTGVAILFSIDDALGPLNSNNLAWVTSAAPPRPAEGEVPSTKLAWNFGFVEGFAGNPGVGRNMFKVGPIGTICSTAGGGGSFVAATARNTKDTTPVENRPLPVPLQTATVSTSTDGSSWTQNDIAGVLVGSRNAGESVTNAVVFVQSEKNNKGYFLCTVTNNGPTASYTTLHKSEDGSAWGSSIKRSDGYLMTLSAIAKDPSTTTIVHI